MSAAQNQALAALSYTDAERTTLHLRSLATLGSMYCGVVVASRFPSLFWPVFVFNAFASIRYSGYIHALTHAYTPNQKVPWLLELLPVLWSPLIPGFSEARKIHMEHHKYQTSENDPDNAIIDGNSKLLIFLKCGFIFEYWIVHCIQRGWVSRQYWTSWTLRLALIAGLTWLAGPWAMVICLFLAAKLGIASAFFIFSYRAHVEHGQLGTFRRPLPQVLITLNHLLIGRYAADPASLHDIHHARPSVSCKLLYPAAKILDQPAELVPAPAAVN
jgi:hypothetical protein